MEKISMKEKKKMKVQSQLEEDHGQKELISKRKSMISITCVILFLIIISVGIFNSKMFSTKTKLMDKNVAIRVEDEKVSRDLFLYYLKKGRMYYEEEAGLDVWDAKIEGKTAFENLKDSITQKIVEIKVATNRAKSEGIIISNDEIKKNIKNFDDEVEKEYVKDQLLIKKLKEHYYNLFDFKEEEYIKYLDSKHIDYKNISNDEYETLKDAYIVETTDKLYAQDLKLWMKDKDVHVNEQIYEEITLDDLK